MKTTLLAAFLLSLSSDIPQLTWSLVGISKEEGMGWSIEQVDLKTVLLGTPGSQKVRVVDVTSTSPKVVRTLSFPEIPNFGYSLLSIGDVNFDNCPDFIVGSPLSKGTSLTSAEKTIPRGEIHIFKSQKVDRLNCDYPRAQIIAGRRNNEYFGRVLVWIGGPLKLFLVSAPSFFAGTGYVFSAKTGQFVYELQRSPLDLPNVSERKGYAAWNVGDLNKDGVDDVALGAIIQKTDEDYPLGKGRIYFYSGKEGKLLSVLEGQNATSHLGISLSKTGDLNGDGIPDVIVGAPQQYSTIGVKRVGAIYWINGAVLVPKTPKVFVVDERAPYVLHYVLGKAENGLLGQQLATVKDLTRDGVKELVVSASGESDTGTNRGRVYLVDGRTFAPLAKVEGVKDGQWLGYTLQPMINRWGLQEVWIGSPFYTPDQPQAGQDLQFAGRVDVYNYGR